MKKIVVFAAAALALLLPAAARAHYLWATVAHGQVRVALLEDVNTAPTAAFARYVSTLTPRFGGVPLALGASKDGARYAALPVGQTLVTADSIVGAKQRGGVPSLLVYHAKGAISLAAAGTMTQKTGRTAPEICARRIGNGLRVTVRRNAAAAPGAEVFVQWPGREAGEPVRTDAQGEVSVPWPAAVGDGFVGVRALVIQAKSGEQNGVKYDTIHHWATLTFPLGEGPPSAINNTRTNAK